MTQLLYQNNSYLTQFFATVTGCEKAQKDGCFLITLSETAFYPEGGGQPADTGTLDGAAVLDVQEKCGEVYHLTNTAFLVGKTVSGIIDWERRFDLMQQHSGEHIVSGLLHAAVGASNVGFHLGSEIVTIDLDKPVTLEILLAIERQANEIVFANHETVLSYPTKQALLSIDYRSKKPIDGQVRLVEFPAADLCACCGTHVARTGEIGLIKFCSLQNYKGGVRIGMVSGRRAVELSIREHGQVAAISGILSAKQPDIVPAVRAQADALAQMRQAANHAVTALLEHKAKSFAGQTLALCFEDNLTPDQSRRYALAICETGCPAAFVFCGDDIIGYRYALSGKDPAKTKSLHEEMKLSLAAKGGGKDGFFQGSSSATRAAIEAFFQK